jgi:quercetin dioxygenase-like cupin family protein
VDRGYQIVREVPADGIITPEGRVGRLLRGVSCSLQYLELPAGLYLGEHAHPWESIVYTIRGRWVLCSGGAREVIGPGSVAWFSPGLCKGYEVPFDEPALLLVFRPAADQRDDRAYANDWAEATAKMEQMRAEGAVFRFEDLPQDHPAKQYYLSTK